MNVTSSSTLARGEIHRKSSGWDENRVFLEDDKLGRGQEPALSQYVHARFRPLCQRERIR
jgi:hypothetical protein